MAEEKEAPKKKGGKGMMIIIAVLVIAVAGMGVFTLRGGGDKAEEKKVELGHVEDLGEFLVNLSDGTTYLSVHVQAHTAEEATVSMPDDGHGGGGGAHPAVRDAVIEVLTSKTLGEISTPEGKEQLKIDLAAAINHAAETSLHHGDEGGHDELAEEEKSEKGDDGHSKPAKPKHEGWHSDTGPALKIYFTKFTMQR